MLFHAIIKMIGSHYSIVTRANLTNSLKSYQYGVGVAQLPDKVNLSAPNIGTLSGTVISMLFRGDRARFNVVESKGPTNGTLAKILSIFAILPTTTLIVSGFVAVPAL